MHDDVVIDLDFIDKCQGDLHADPVQIDRRLIALQDLDHPCRHRKTHVSNLFSGPSQERIASVSQPRKGDVGLTVTQGTVVRRQRAGLEDPQPRCSERSTQPTRQNRIEHTASGQHHLIDLARRRRLADPDCKSLGEGGVKQCRAEGLIHGISKPCQQRSKIENTGGVESIPTRHRLDIGDTTRWTWCALDAIGILGALRRHATFTTQVPDAADELTVTFTADGPEPTDTVVFIADGYGNDSVVDTWCPTVNLFANADAATNCDR